MWEIKIKMFKAADFKFMSASGMNPVHSNRNSGYHLLMVICIFPSFGDIDIPRVHFSWVKQEPAFCDIYPGRWLPESSLIF